MAAPVILRPSITLLSFAFNSQTKTRQIRALDADSCCRFFSLFACFIPNAIAIAFCFLFAQNLIKCGVCVRVSECVYFRLYNIRILYTVTVHSKAVTFNLPHYSNKIHPVHWPAASNKIEKEAQRTHTQTQIAEYDTHETNTRSLTHSLTFIDNEHETGKKIGDLHKQDQLFRIMSVGKFNARQVVCFKKQEKLEQ